MFQISRRRFLGGMIAAPVLSAIPFPSAESGTVQPSLARAAHSNGRFFGAAARIDQIDAEPALRAAMLRDCACLTPEIHLKWDSLEPAPGQHDFAPADGLADFAKANGLKLRGHTLLWEQSTPDWARRAIARDKDWSLIERHFGTVMPRYRSRIDEWDVVNEPIDSEHGRGGLRRNSFFRAFGPDYIRRALDEAHRHAPGALLMINDYGFDYDNPVEEDRRRLMLRLAERLKREGAPLGGIGVQAHLDLSKGPFKPRIVRDFLRDLAGLDLRIVITELDVKEQDLTAPIEVRDARVAAEVGAYVETALAEPAVKGIVTWGLSDRHSWLQDQVEQPSSLKGPARLNRGLPYDSKLEPKAMYWTLREALLT